MVATEIILLIIKSFFRNLNQEAAGVGSKAIIGGRFLLS
jgi:hypothetical protein